MNNLLLLLALPKNKAVIRTNEDIISLEDIKPADEDKNFIIDVIDGAEGVSEEEEEEDKSETFSEQKEGSYQLEVEQAIEDSESDEKNSNILVQDFGDIDTTKANSAIKSKDRMLKNNKDLLVGLLNDEYSGIEIEKELEEDKENKKINRSIVSNEITAFLSIKKKLTEIVKAQKMKYNNSTLKFEEIMELFEQASCRYEVLEEYLSSNNKSNKMWKSLEDFVLIKPHMNEEAYGLLKAEKGEEEIENRKKFLDLK